ncbi:hypothetical protein [Saccharicrinis sp. GN24d3]|uniref:hypothetical protein n=1 Tax=Saccharicrinis sp. GN24d3 TaxID=3458416 RepID=UPI004035FEEF
MDLTGESFQLSISDMILEFKSYSEKIRLDAQGQVKHFVCSKCTKPDYIFNYSTVDEHTLEDATVVFTGQPGHNELLNYNWEVLMRDQAIYIRVNFVDHADILSILAKVSKNSTIVGVELVLHNLSADVVSVDPLIHPLGSLILLYLTHWKNGLLIHASGVLDKNEAYLFTGVSGIGKSTMARLWKESGAAVLNDDRLVIRRIDGRIMVYNNPMPYYAQRPLRGELKKIFLLKQSLHNYITPLKGVAAYSRVLGNFIQQFYQKEMVQRHLEIVEQTINLVDVYEVGFKPDQDIVEMIREMD